MTKNLIKQVTIFAQKAIKSYKFRFQIIPSTNAYKFYVEHLDKFIEDYA